MTTIKLKNGSGAPTAGDLVQGEPALDLTNKRLYTENASGTVIEVGTNPSAEIVANGGIALPDNGKATFGASDDLQIYHNGSNSIITETGTGNLYLGGDNLLLTNGSLSAAYLEAITGGAVNIYHNGSTKLATTATGIDVTGNVLVGKSSISNVLGWSEVVQVGGANPAISLDNSSSVQWDIANFGGNFTIWKDGSEQVRIDSSGNLLVGKTTTSNATAGAELNASGQIVGTFAGGTHILGRNTNDGSILTLQKDGTTVGSIGVNASTILQVSSASTGGLFLADNGTNVAGLVNGENAFRPASDALISLGKTDRRFKDLYLSGGVYLGGTGAANKLDDYEEGTWTPAFGGTGSNPSVTYSVAVGHYTKVGRLVTVSWRLQVSAISGGSGLAQITGLPFTQAAAAGNAHVQITALTNMSGPASKNGGFVEPSAAFIYLCNDNGLTFSPSSLGTGIFFGSANYFTA